MSQHGHEAFESLTHMLKLAHGILFLYTVCHPAVLSMQHAFDSLSGAALALLVIET